VLPGFIWGAWHLPQFFIRDGDSYRQALPVFVLRVTAMSVAFAWLYARTNGSLLLTMLMHAGDQQLAERCPVSGSRWNRYVRIPRIAHFVDLACAALHLCRVLPERYAKANAGNTTNAIST